MTAGVTVSKPHTLLPSPRTYKRCGAAAGCSLNGQHALSRIVLVATLNWNQCRLDGAVSVVGIGTAARYRQWLEMTLVKAGP